MICSLLLLYASDGQRTKNDLLHHLKGIPCHSICVDDSEFSQHHALKDPSSSCRLQIVFFSPGFLKFLECRYDEAYSSFGKLDPCSTVALFCCGLQEREVMCYHIAPLNSYNSWLKFEAVNQDNGGESSGFSPYLMQLIEEVFPPEDYPGRRVIVVPELLNRESNDIYVMFPNPIESSADISVHIENWSDLSIGTENFNPYIIQFRVPDAVLEDCETFNVQIHQSGDILVEKLVRIIQDPVAARDKFQRKDSRLEKNSRLIMLEKELQVLSDIGGLSLQELENNCNDRMCSISSSDEEINHSLINLCRKYGLEELSLFIEKPSEIQNTIFCRSTNIAEKDLNDRIYTGTDPHIITPSDDAELMGGVTRSMSLPLNLSRDNLASGEYLPMNQGNSRPRSHLFQAMDNTLSVNEIISNNTYVCMTLGRDSGSLMDAAKKVLSQSQQELLEIMNDFKKGRNTISDVEGRFQMWQEKHGCHEKQHQAHQDYEEEDFAKHPTTFFGGGWNLFKRKTSSASDSGKRLSGISGQSSHSSQETIRKFSSASASSTSSKASDGSVLSVCNQRSNDTAKLAFEVSTGWIPTYSTRNPLNPARPRPNSRAKIEAKECMKRRAGTHLTLALNEQLYTDDKPEESTTGECNQELVQSLLEACGKYSLEPLGEYFVAEYQSARKSNSKNLDAVNLDTDKNVSNNNKEHDRLSQLTSSETDTDLDDNISSLRRSLSLPNGLLHTEGTKVAIPPGDNHEQHGRECSLHASVYKCDDFVHSIHSNIYASIMSIMESNDRGRNQNLGSQQELFELLEAFKKGSRTISQVEREFKAWNERHLVASTMRDNQLLLLQKMYVEAQKPIGKRKILNIKKRKILKNSKSSDGTKTTKTYADKADNDKDCFTRPSSMVSENGDVFKNCVYNPEYKEKKQDAISTNPKSRRPSSPEPPPLPPRPPPQPIKVMRTCQHISSQGRRNEDWSNGTAKPVGPHKPSLPPKPPNLYKKVSIGHEEGKDYESRPASPVYITPDPFITASQRKKMSVPTPPTKKANGPWTNNSPCHVCPVSVAHVCHKTSVAVAPSNWNSSSCPATMTKADSSRKKNSSTSASPNKHQAENSAKWQFLPNPWAAKPKKEESMFYVTRRWSSVPDDIQLSVGPDQKPEPIYLELIDQSDGRVRSISESTSPKD